MIVAGAADPRPEPVTDPDSPDWVEPAPAAVRVNPANLLAPFTAPRWPAQTPVTDPLPGGEVGTSLPQAPDDDPERNPEGCS